ncbi:phosphatase PAP2 family protein [Pseudonocardia sp.]|uniref:phosphatase PAP2 family protein n=1 Tax=Pseudonocardia sp. TaxID=60912 RepID=UPI002F3F0526
MGQVAVLARQLSIRARASAPLLVAIVLLWLALAVFAGAAPQPTAVDLAGHRLVHGQPGGTWTWLALAVTTAASSPVLYPVTAVASALVSRRAEWSRLVDALVVTVVLGLGSAARFGCSVLIARARPPAADWLAQATGFSFPSGHTANTTIAAGLLALAYHHTADARGRRVAAWVTALVAAVAAGWSRVYLGVHWPTDVAGGWLFGAGWIALVGLVSHRLATPR